MMLLGLLLWALVSAPAGGADVDEGWQVNQNSRPKLNVMMTCLGGCPVVRLVSQESRGFVCSASYETCMLPGIPRCADGETLVFPWTYRSEPNASFQMPAHETMCAATMCGCDSNLDAGEKCWSPVCRSDLILFPCCATVEVEHIRWGCMSDNVQCNSGNFNNLTSIGWKVGMFSMVDAFPSQDRCNSGSLDSANLFQCDAGNFDRVHGFHADHVSVTGDAFSSECFFQYDSGNFNKHDYGEMCKTFSLRHVHWLVTQQFPGELCSGFQDWNSLSDVSTCYAEEHEGCQALDGHAWSQGNLFLSNAVHEEMRYSRYNWSDAASIEDEFNVVSVVGLSTFQDGCKLFAACVSTVKGTIWFLARCTGIQLAMVAFTMTAIACLMWYLWIDASHLSYGRKMQCRLEKRRSRRAMKQVQMQLVAAIFLCSLGNARAMEEATGQSQMQEAFLQRMTSMAEAATRAAMAAEKALEKTSSSGGASSIEGLQAASRILKPPDTYNGEDVMLFQQWKHQFTSWLCFGDGRYSDVLPVLEKKSAAPEWSTYNADERSMAQKLYAVLTSYLRGRCSHMVRAESQLKDGFKLWYNLNQEFLPSTRQRSLALAQALGAYPVFPKDKSALESKLSYEQLVHEYEQASGSTYPKELMSATLIRCCNPRLREQIQLGISDTTTYADIRDRITSFEKVSKAWTSEQVLKHISEPPNYASTTNDGPTPMEVDRVEKGKGKQKGKSKSKGGSGAEWAGSWMFHRGRG